MQSIVLKSILGALFVGLATNSMADVKSIEARSGGGFKVHIFEAEEPTAAVLMFEGGSGVFTPDGGGFVNSQYDAFVEHGFTVVVMQPPAGLRQPFKGGMHPLFRQTPAHAKDIGATVEMIQTQFELPVWLLGTSWGTKSVANYAEAHPDRLEGVIFLSSATAHLPPKFKSVTDHDLTGVKGAVLSVAHRGDRCKESPPGSAQKIADAATNSSNAKAILFEGGTARGKDPCLPKSHHTFSGIEKEVVLAVAEFIRENTVVTSAAAKSTSDYPFDGAWQVNVREKSGCRNNQDSSFTITVANGKIDESQQRPAKSGEVATDGQFVITISNPNTPRETELSGKLEGDSGAGALKIGQCSGKVTLVRTN